MQKIFSLFRPMATWLVLCCCILFVGCSTKLDLDKDRRVVALRAKVVATVKTQLGKPYRYGGTNPKAGFDCSGLLMWAYAKHGINIPRSTDDQADVGDSICEDDIRQGDIVVFSMGFFSGLHTGMYVGNNTFIHSPSSGKRIRTDSLDNPYWESKLDDIRRVIQ